MVFTIWEREGGYRARERTHTCYIPNKCVRPVGMVFVNRTRPVSLGDAWNERYQIITEKCIAAWKAGVKNIVE